jgi:hypothetical protein
MTLLKRNILTLLCTILTIGFAMAQEKPEQLTITAHDGHKTVLTLADLKQLPRETVTAKDPKTKEARKYEGVLLSSVLVKAGAPTGKTLHGPELRDYVVVTGSDGYHVIFSLSELDQPTHANHVLLADSVDGNAFDTTHGPLAIIAPDDQRPERWVRMVTEISIHQAE